MDACPPQQFVQNAGMLVIARAAVQHQLYSIMAQMQRARAQHGRQTGSHACCVAAGNCCTGVLTEDESCCESSALDLCGVCDGANTGCLYAGSLHFGISSALSDTEADALCSRVLDTLFTAGLTLSQISDVGCELSDSGAAGRAAFTVQLPMEAATARVLAALQLLNPRALQPLALLTSTHLFTRKLSP